MPTVLITGAARGLGLEFARQYREAGWDVVATARQSNEALASLGIAVHNLDVSDFGAVEAFGTGLDRPIDLLIANAGIATPFEAKSVTDAEGWVDLLRVNTVAPVLLAQAVLPRLEEVKGKAIAISSQMGSIADSSTGWIPYRASRSALNMAWHALANEWRGKGIAMATLHPGWVQTDMGGPNATIDVSTSIAGMRKVIDALTIEQSGSFLNYEGRQLPW